MSSAIESSNLAPLHPPRRRLRIFLLILMELFIVALTATITHYTPPVWRRIVLSHYQKPCLTYSAPADQVVYDDDPARMPALFATGSYSTVNADGKNAAAIIPFCWRNFRRRALPNDPDNAILFLHELTSKTGIHRLVVVYYTPHTNVPDSPTDPWDIGWRTFDPDTPGKLVDPPTEWYTRDIGGQFSYGQWPLMSPIRFYAGQADPNDPAHFTIDYELNGRRYVINGRLTDEGNVIRYETRDGQPAPPVESPLPNH